MVVVTYTSNRKPGLQKKAFKYMSSYKAWENTLAGIVTVIMVEEHK